MMGEEGIRHGTRSSSSPGMGIAHLVSSTWIVVDFDRTYHARSARSYCNIFFKFKVGGVSVYHWTNEREQEARWALRWCSNTAWKTQSLRNDSSVIIIILIFLDIDQVSLNLLLIIFSWEASVSTSSPTSLASSHLISGTYLKYNCY
jgi:hypothetical protein